MLYKMNLETMQRSRYKFTVDCGMVPRQISKNRVWILLLCVLYGAVIYGIYKGSNTISTGAEYADNSTEETCEIVSVESYTCSYSCRSATGKSKTCWGTKYSYTAFAREKCGEDPLYSSQTDDDDCPGVYYGPQQTTTCYVLSCAEQEFSLWHSSAHIASGVFWSIGSIVLACCPCCFLAYF